MTVMRHPPRPPTLDWRQLVGFSSGSQVKNTAASLSSERVLHLAFVSRAEAATALRLFQMSPLVAVGGFCSRLTNQ